MADPSFVGGPSVKSFKQLSTAQQASLAELFNTRLGLDMNELPGYRQLAFVDSEGSVLAGIEFHPRKGIINLMAQATGPRRLSSTIAALNPNSRRARDNRPKYWASVSPMEELFFHAAEMIRLNRKARGVRGKFLKEGRIFLQKRRGRFAANGLKVNSPDRNLSRGEDREIEFSFMKIPRPFPLRVNPVWRK